jgi:hypothetical protein
MKGFPPKWCDWITRFIQGGGVGIRVNNDIGQYFQTLKGLPQDEPLSPIPINIVGICWESLFPEIRRMTRLDNSYLILFRGALYSGIRRSHDSFYGAQLREIFNMKLVLCLFEQLPALKLFSIRVKFSIFQGQKR